MAQKSYRDILLDHFLIRRKNQGGYSLRAFARDLNLYPSHLSAVLVKKRGLSAKTAVEISESLNLNQAEREEFVDLVNSEHARSVVERNRAVERLAERNQKIQQQALDTKSFDFFDRWYYAAVWQLISVSNGEGTPQTWAKSLGLSEADMNVALEFLQEAQFIVFLDGKYVCRTGFFSGASASPQKSIRNWHAQILTLAAERIEELEQRLRKNAATIMAFDSSRAEEAREFLQGMHDEFISRFQPPDSADCVYAVSLNLFRLDVQEARS